MTINSNLKGIIKYLENKKNIDTLTATKMVLNSNLPAVVQDKNTFSKRNRCCNKKLQYIEREHNYHCKICDSRYFPLDILYEMYGNSLCYFYGEIHRQLKGKSTSIKNNKLHGEDLSRFITDRSIIEHLVDEEYNKNSLKSSKTLEQIQQELREVLLYGIEAEELINQDELSAKYRELVLRELIDVNLKFGKYDIVKLLSEELFG